MTKQMEKWGRVALCLLIPLVILALVGFAPTRRKGECLACTGASSAIGVSLTEKKAAQELLDQGVPAIASVGLDLLSAVQDTEVPSAYQIEDFPIVYQMPQLPTGCEITALTMALHYYGYSVDKVTMATQYLPTAPAGTYYGSDGRLYGSDMEHYFVGDPTTNLGYICGTSAIVTAANTYLEEQGSSLRAQDLTGAAPEELYELVSRDIPVVVWVTIGMEDRRSTQGWYTEAGEYMEWSTNDHGAVLIGYTETTVTIADPISGLVEYDRQQFEEVFATRSNRCVILTE